jgi:hypothetical protein
MPEQLRKFLVLWTFPPMRTCGRTLYNSRLGAQGIKYSLGPTVVYRNDLYLYCGMLHIRSHGCSGDAALLLVGYKWYGVQGGCLLH